MADEPSRISDDVLPTAVSSSSDSTGMSQDRIVDDQRMLLDFVRNRDVPCPRCDYNLRNLSQSMCPECKEPLRLTVGVQKLRLGPLVLSIAPGIFSGMAAMFLTARIAMVLMARAPGKGPPWFVFLILGFGWFSGLFAVGLFATKKKFLRLSPETQLAWTGTIWAVHIGFFLLLWAILP
ncbi:MAG TPA: hypothetical protein VG711_09875 [Phycisphaerales bacterium]|nr:hypothetical protein [Phycisphaerales bacterium]